MNGSYFLFLTIGAVLCTGLFAWRLRRIGMKAAGAFITLPLAAVLCMTASKLGFFLLDFGEQFQTYGFEALLRTRPAEFSFVSGCAGMVLAVLLGAKISRQPAVASLDAFAPCGALMAAIVRACEGLLDPMSLVGMGGYVENEALWFFPVAMENQMLYSWFYAVFMLEAACALICAAVGFALGHKRFAPGRVFLHTAFFLAIPQVFCERMLNQCMKWGFVRIEQLLCAAIAFAVILCACIMYRKKGFKAFIPALLALVCIAVLIDIEFTLDNKPPFGLEMSTTMCYVLMIGTLCCMSALSLYAFHRLNKKEA